MQLSFKRTTWVVIAIACFISYKGVSALSGTWSEKIRLQEGSNYTAHTSLSIWQFLSEFREQWPSRYKSLSSGTQSRLDLLKQLGLASAGLKPVTSNLADIQSFSVSQDGLDIGLITTCVTNSQNGFVMTAPDIHTAHKGLSRLEARSELLISGVSIINNTNGFEIIVRKLCVVFSAEQTS
jgi:hypothetical protein